MMNHEVLCLFQIGFTPLHWASWNGHLDVVKLLIKRNAEIDVPAKVCSGLVM